MGFKMDKHKKPAEELAREAALEKIKELDRSGLGLQLNERGEKKLAKLQRTGKDAFKPVAEAVPVHNKHAYSASQVLTREQVEARASRCREKNLCFISLKPLANEIAVAHAVGGIVPVLGIYGV